MARGKTITEEEFWSRAEPDPATGCWNWKWAKNHAGYGKLRYRYDHWLAHRLAYYLHYGRVEQLVLHSCDNPACINPAHLREGTHQDNMNDVKERGRHGMLGKFLAKCKRGLHELTPENVCRDYYGFRMCRICRNERAYESRDRSRIFNALF